ncbi:MAG: hypothetical protein AAF368_19570, partial [Planctomycetota bacterium]
QIALARIAARATGQGEAEEEVAAEIVEALLERCQKGDTGERAWASLALGLHEYKKANAGGASSLKVRAVLVDRFRRGKNVGEVAAAAVGLGLAGEREIHRDLIREMTGGHFIVRGLYAAALPLMKAEEALGALRRELASEVPIPVFQREATQALAMFRDVSLTEQMTAAIKRAESTDEQVAVLHGAMRSGETRMVPLLLEILNEKRLGKRKIDDRARAFAAVALGSICSRRALRWNAHLALEVTWSAAPPTLTFEQAGGGVLDLL